MTRHPLIIIFQAFAMHSIHDLHQFCHQEIQEKYNMIHRRLFYASSYVKKFFTS